MVDPCASDSDGETGDGPAHFQVGAPVSCSPSFFLLWFDVFGVWFFFRFYRIELGSYWVLPLLIWFLPSFTWFYLVFTGLYWVFRGFTVCYWVPTGFYLVLPGFTEFYWVLLG